MQKTNALNVLDANGIPLKISEKEWSNLSDQTIQSIQNINLQNFQDFYSIQKQIIQEEMAVAYGYMFVFCAIAYLLAWRIMKWLVPREKLISLP